MCLSPSGVLVALGAAAFTDLGTRRAGIEGATRIVAGIDFLGAGVILKEGTQIRGLNTAATLWCFAAAGAFAGAALWAEAVALSVFVVAGNTLLRPLVNYINRLPIDTRTTEARYPVHVVTDHRKVSAARDILHGTLEKVGYPILEIETLSETETQVERAAILVPSSADPLVLDAVVAQLEKAPRSTGPPGRSARRRKATTAPSDGRSPRCSGIIPRSEWSWDRNGGYRGHVGCAERRRRSTAVGALRRRQPPVLCG
jgi:putative Mg2+ transporter-C (MgtC) family protein